MNVGKAVSGGGPDIPSNRWLTARNTLLYEHVLHINPQMAKPRPKKTSVLIFQSKQDNR